MPRYDDLHVGKPEGLSPDDDSANEEWADDGGYGMPPLWRRAESLVACWVLMATAVAIAATVYAGGAHMGAPPIAED